MPRWTRSAPPPLGFHWVEVEDVELSREVHGAGYPPISPWKAKALLRRWSEYKDGYAAMLPRWTAERAWSEVVLPARVSAAEILVAFQAAWSIGYDTTGDFPDVFIYHSSGSEFLSISAVRAAVGAAAPPSGWAEGDRAAHYDSGNGLNAAIYGRYQPGYALAAYLGQTVTLRTGREAQSHASDVGGPSFYPVVTRTKNNDVAFFDTALRVAGAVLWRMWYVAARLQEDDWLCLNEGGRGGPRVEPKND